MTKGDKGEVGPQGPKGDKGDSGGVMPADMVDYMGNQHDSLKKKNDADVEWLLGEVNTAHYEGQQITATNTLEGRSKSAILKGQTLVNLLKFDELDSKINKVGDTITVTNGTDTSAWYGGRIYLTKSIERNKKYIVVWDNLEWTHTHVNGKMGVIQVLTKNVSTNRDLKIEQTGNDDRNYMIFSCTDENGDLSKVQIAVLATSWATGEVNNLTTIKGLKMFEYQQGMENWGIPYFEGMQSVKLPVLTTTGKNLFDIDSVSIKGNVVIKNSTIIITPNGTWRNQAITTISVNCGETYVLSFNNGVDNSNTGSIKIYDGESVEDILIDQSTSGVSGGKVLKFTPNTNKIKVVIEQYGSNGIFIMSDIQIEKGSVATTYEPYKSNILTTTGKNLFNMNRPYDNLTDSQATVVQDTNQITVSSSESGTYVNANFILDKDFFAGKTVTGSCLYETDEKDIGTVQIVYQDGNGEHHYQWIRTPRTFTFPNSFIGDIMLSVSANNTGTPQSNTVTVKNIQLELGSTTTPYEPYSEVALRGIGDVKDELNLLTGELTQRIGEVVLDGSEDWIVWRENDNSYGFALRNYKIDFKPSSIPLCNRLVGANYSYMYNGIISKGIALYTGNSTTGYSIFIRLPKTECTGLEDFKTKLQANPLTVQYELETPVVKTVDLSDNHVYSYKDTTHYACSSEEGSLVPTLSIDVPTNLPALVSKQRATIESQKEQIATLETENEQLIAQNELQDVEIALNQDAINFILFQAMNMNQKTKGVNMMAAYFANQILKGKLDYALVVSRYPEYKEDIDTILIAEGKQDLIK